MQASIATKCSHFGMTERRRGRLYETSHFSGLVELSPLGKRRQNLATIKDYTRKIAEALHVFRNPYGSAMKMQAFSLLSPCMVLRPHEHAVRHRRRQGFRFGSQPPRISHGAAGLQGL